MAETGRLELGSEWIHEGENVIVRCDDRGDIWPYLIQRVDDPGYYDWVGREDLHPILDKKLAPEPIEPEPPKYRFHKGQAVRVTGGAHKDKTGFIQFDEPVQDRPVFQEHWFVLLSGCTWMGQEISIGYLEPIPTESAQPEPTPEPDMVNSPSHYVGSGGMQVHDFIEAFGLDRSHYLASAVEYIARCDRKGNAVEDIRKAIRCLTRDLERREKVGQ